MKTVSCRVDDQNCCQFIAFPTAESKKDSSSTQIKEVETKLKKSLDENKSISEKIKQLEDKLAKQDFEVKQRQNFLELVLIVLSSSKAQTNGNNENVI
jgi:septal ring factor EnvC (AmiA/AmiB activator)